MTFQSEVVSVGPVAFPVPKGTRIMMMPFRFEDVQGTLPPELSAWADLVQKLVAATEVTSGVGYLTIDEALVKAGETHRRPGLHVDGIGADGRSAKYGGGGGYGGGKGGMVLASSHTGAVAWEQSFEGWPGPNGDCETLRSELRTEAEIPMVGGQAFWCGALTVHESLPMKEDCFRQFIRVSSPSKAPWHEGYTANPLGVLPEGAIEGPRENFMKYRSST